MNKAACDRSSCGYCIANVKGRSAFAGHCGYRPYKPKLRPFWEMIVKRPTDSQSGASLRATLAEDKVLSKYPALLSYLADTTYDDGAARETSAFSLFLDDGVWKGALNDKDLRRSLYVTGLTFTEVLIALDKQCQAPNADWRAWNKSTKKK